MLSSLVTSHTIYLFIAIIQSYVFRKFKSFKFIYRLAAEDLMHILMFISAVLAWKFYWMFAEYFFKTSATEFYLYVICHFVSFFTALLLRVSAILVGPGNSFMDGQYPTDNIAYFEIEYLYFIFLVSSSNFLFIPNTQTKVFLFTKSTCKILTLFEETNWRIDVSLYKTKIRFFKLFVCIVTHFCKIFLLRKLDIL